jgi:glycerophosphoryl diester phosphodiesterase
VRPLPSLLPHRRALPPPDRPLVVAHRGASLAEPEHTVRAMERALADGADGVECDVRLTRDQRAVCFHDSGLERTSDGRGLLYRRTLAELHRLDYGEGPGILTLRRLVEFCRDAPRPLGLLVETKHPSRWWWRVEREVVADLRRVLGPGLDGLPFLAVMSFSPVAVRRLAALAPRLERVRLRSHRAPIPQLSTSHVAGLDLRLVLADPTVVADCHRLGQRVYVWTVNHPEDVTTCTRLGVDGIITDDPGMARTVVDEIAGPR